MSYKEYYLLHTPNEVLEKMAEFVTSCGYKVVEECSDDHDIYDGKVVDGKKFIFKDILGTNYISMRSCNGVNIFGSYVNSEMSNLSASDYSNTSYCGIGMTSFKSFDTQNRWYGDSSAPIQLGTTNVLGVYMPVPPINDEIDVVVEPVKPTAPVAPDLADAPVMPAQPTYPAKPVAPIAPTLEYVPEPAEPPNEDIQLYYHSNGKTNFNSSYFTTNQLANRPINYSYDSNKDLILDDVVAPIQSEYVLAARNISTKGYSSLIRLCNNSISSIKPIDSSISDFRSWAFSWDEISSSMVVSDIPTSDTWSHGDEHILLRNSSVVYLGISDSNGSYSMCGVLVAIPIARYNEIIANKKKHYAWEHKTSAEWQTYYVKAKEATDKYNAEIVEYYKAMEVYNSDMEAYRKEVARLDEEYRQNMLQYYHDMVLYNQSVGTYNAYLSELSEYNENYRIYSENYIKYMIYLGEYERLRYRYNLYCNDIIHDNGRTLIFSLVKMNSNLYQTTHLIVGNLNKNSDFNGGVFISGSYNQDKLEIPNYVYKDVDLSSPVTYPVLSSIDKSVTFLDIYTNNGNFVNWASSGTNNDTGLKLTTSVRSRYSTGNGKVPNYYNIQSKDRLDWGKNVCVVNGTTLNLPIDFAVNVEPTTLDTYACVGTVYGINFVSLLNTQTTCRYGENKFVEAGDYQVFPMDKRRGCYGFDGISIKHTIDSYESCLDLTKMQSLADTTDSIIDISNETTGIKAFGGHYSFTDSAMNDSSLLLSSPYTDYEYFVITYTEESGTNLYTVYWNKYELADALSKTTTFDLLKDKKNGGCYWNINPTSSTTTILYGAGQNCGIVDIVGHK